MSCPRCKDSGWVIVQRAGVEAADRCPCFDRRQSARRVPPSSDACAHVARRILASTPYVRKDDTELLAEVTFWLTKRIETDRELEIFHVYAVENLTEWRGIAGLKTLLGEMRAKLSERAEHDKLLEYDRQLAAWKEEIRQLGASPEPFTLPGQLKRIPGAQVIDAEAV